MLFRSEIKNIFNLIYKYTYAYLTQQINNFNTNIANNPDIFGISNEFIQRYLIKNTLISGLAVISIRNPKCEIAVWQSCSMS